MGNHVKKTLLNLGCGYKKFIGEEWVNVDAHSICSPDIVCDLNTFPYPWEDNSIDHIYMSHVLEHIPDWWGSFLECSRILKIGGTIEIRVPDESSSTALTYRDHHHVFSMLSFHGIQEASHGTNAWAKTEENSVPMILTGYGQVPFKRYNWMLRFPWLLKFCANHMRNFIHEQVFYFQKVGVKNG